MCKEKGDRSNKPSAALKLGLVRYSHLYRSLCLVLSDKSDQVIWEAFSNDDWFVFTRLGRQEGVAPLIHWKWKQQGAPPSTPEQVLSDLATSYYQTAANNAILFRELERIQEALSAAGVPVIVLKGAALATTVYPDPALRPMGDIDLLVRRELLEQASEIVRGLGFQPASEAPELRPGLLNLVSYGIELIDESLDTCLVELHWNLIGGKASRYQPDLDWFWNQIDSIDLDGINVSILNPTASFLYLAAHLSYKHVLLKPEKEKLIRILWFYDLFRLWTIWGDRIDWKELVDSAHSFSWGVGLAAALRGLYDRFEFDPALDLIDQFTTNMDKQTLELVEMTALGQHRDVLHYRALKLPARWRLYLANFLPSPAYMRWRYAPNPLWLWPFYYPYRWIGALTGLLGKGV